MNNNMAAVGIEESETHLIIKLMGFRSKVPGSGGPRGKIHNFSFQSRRRMLEKLIKISEKYVPVFVTVTYSYDVEVQEAKLHIDRLFQIITKRLSCCIFWKMEFTKQGRIHFHMCVVGNESNIKYKIRSFIDSEWSSIISRSEEEYDKHLKSSCRVEIPKKSLLGYITKYVTKEEDDLEVAYPGRFWGLRNRILYQKLLKNADIRLYDDTYYQRAKKMIDIITDSKHYYTLLLYGWDIQIYKQLIADLKI